MFDLIRYYLTVIDTERSWSWTMIGILYLVLALLVRGLAMRPIVSKAKQLKYSLYQEVKLAYLRNSIWGWLFFFVPLGVAIYMWMDLQKHPLTVRDLLIMAGAMISYSLSIMFHALAFGLAGIKALKQAYDREVSAEI
jgi:hypothetical protein